MAAEATTPMSPRGMVALSQTVQGYSHTTHDKPCQDASCHLEAEDGSWRLVVVSDGHGDPSCMRSDRGSKMAVEAAAGCLQAFAEAFDEPDSAGHTLASDLRVPARRAALVRRLTDAILARWTAAVHADLAADPLTEAELAQASDRARALYLRGERLEHVYGATLLCALWLPRMLVLLQQGDGVCLVARTDGDLWEPVPEDERCQANVTTSLCDTDAADSIRHALVAFDRDPSMAVILGSDGVGNSFAGAANLEGYVMRLLVDVASDGDATRVELGLEPGLARLSQTGSGDDMSLALIADVDAVARVADGYAAVVRLQELRAHAAALQDKVVSMGRKHAILAQRRDAALADRARLEDDVLDCQVRLGDARVAVEQSKAHLEELMALCEHAERATEAARAKLEAAPEDPRTLVIGGMAFEVRNPGEREVTRRMREQRRAISRYEQAYARHESLLASVQSLAEELVRAKATLDSFDDADLRAFDQYDAQYQQLQNELREAKEELAQTSTI